MNNINQRIQKSTNQRIKVVFMGTPEFAVASLDKLIENNYNIVGVITAPDKPAGRGRSVQQSAVKKYAEEKGLKILQPEKLKDEGFLAELREMQADLQIVVAFRMLPEVVWSMPPLGTFNLHASLLPQYRGAAPINWAIINGEVETGVTTFFLKHEIDTGDIIFQEKVNIAEDETAGRLHDRLMEIGAGLVLKTVKSIENRNYPTLNQNQISKEGKIKHAPKIFKEDCRINWNDDVGNIYNKIRGLSPYPCAYTEIETMDDKINQLKIYFGTKEYALHSFSPGEIFKVFSLNGIPTGLKIAGKDGFIHITDLQIAGKKRMYTAEFLRGFNIDNIKRAF